MKHILLFNNTAAYEQAVAKGIVEPNVCYVEDGRIVTYNGVKVSSTRFEVSSIIMPTDIAFDATSALVKFIGTTIDVLSDGTEEVAKVEAIEETVTFDANNTTSPKTIEGSFDWNGQSVAYSFEQDAKPSITLNLDAKYEDSSVINLKENTQSTGKVGDINYAVETVATTEGTLDYEVRDGFLYLNSHFDGTIKVTATSANFANVKAEANCEVFCDDIADYQYSVSGVSVEPSAVEGDVTSAKVKFSGTVTPVYSSGKVGQSQTNNYEQEVTFDANDSSEDVTREGSFEWNGVTVNWNVTQMSVIKKAESTAVDLGLPSGLKWAAGNVGAENPEDAGLYFAWGETTGYAGDAGHNFAWANYKWSINGASSNFSKYNTTGATLDLEDDAAHVNLGGSWRMPTKTEMEELINNTTRTWTTNYEDTGVAGYIVKSKTNSNQIFMPATGSCSGTLVGDFGSSALYWSSSQNEYASYDGYYLYFYYGGFYVQYYRRYIGHCVRGVCE